MPRPSGSPLLAPAGALVAVLVVTVLAVVLLRSPGGSPGGSAGSSSGGSNGDPDGGGPGGEATQTPLTTLAQLAADPPSVRRAGFCDRVQPAQVEAALAGPATTVQAYGNGDTVVLGEGVADVAHEHGCRWATAAGAEARAWVFVPPVTAGRAERLVALARRGDGCAVVPGAVYGAPGVVTTCTDPASGAVTTAHQGLFGDAWLTCTLRVPPGPPGSPGSSRAVDRSAPWCVAVAVAAGQPK